ncbi:preprotein translocase subunit SecG [Gynurincola endophyticus]|jgi:preprotein translocase subunit SecG|uniref:preprotein translocase subunit SecG n=1 Tax=Gynurincola endophyticus TaxID=2479004 RepID=UPI000F8CF3E1|nr:preprotein translocase subunit SecG [Gynurincola endophyticus]
MSILFLTLIIIVSVFISILILVQNPKGGGLAGNIAGFNSQFMGVQQTSDILEKGTWICAAIIGVLCLFSSFFITGSGSDVRELKGQPEFNTTAPIQDQPLTLPENTVPLEQTPAPAEQ